MLQSNFLRYKVLEGRKETNVEFKNSNLELIKVNKIRNINQFFASEIPILSITKRVINRVFGSSFPDIVKFNVVILTQKNAFRESIVNYRPISLVPAKYKILKNIIKEQLVLFFEEQDIFIGSI